MEKSERKSEAARVCSAGKSSKKLPNWLNSSLRNVRLLYSATLSKHSWKVKKICELISDRSLRPEAEKEKATTKYYVLAGAGENGPYDLIGVVDASGQQAAKKAGALAVNEKTQDASEKYFLAIPESSWLPKKPGSIKVETTITFD